MTATTRSPSDAPTRCATGSASFDAAERILERPPLPRSPPSPRAAGVARSTLHRRFPNGDALLAALQGAPQETSLETPDGALPAGRLGRERPVSLDAIQVFDVLPRPCCPNSWLPRRSASPRYRWRCTYSTSTAPICCTWPGRDASGTRRRPLRSPGATRGLVRCTRVRPVAARTCQRRGDRIRSTRGAAQRASPSSRGSDHAGRPEHRRVRPRPATQAAHGVLGDPAKRAPAPLSRVTGGEIARTVVPSYAVAGDWFDVI
jgi:AcrR family transcriptional regulator